MYKSRACFKQALRHCKRHKEQIEADGLASSYSKMHAKQFWNDVAKSANHKATTYVNKIGNAVGEENICHMWHDYFKTLYNSVSDSGVNASSRLGGTSLVSRLSACLTEANWWRLIAE